jgi:nucleoporin SEH1
LLVTSPPQFAPKHVGLRVATGSADGVVRIYEAIDVLNLNHWPMSQCFDADVESELGVTCLSWCSGRFEPPMLVVGGSSGRITGEFQGEGEGNYTTKEHASSMASACNAIGSYTSRQYESQKRRKKNGLGNLMRRE